MATTLPGALFAKALVPTIMWIALPSRFGVKRFIAPAIACSRYFTAKDRTPKLVTPDPRAAETRILITPGGIDSPELSRIPRVFRRLMPIRAPRSLRNFLVPLAC